MIKFGWFNEPETYDQWKDALDDQEDDEVFIVPGPPFSAELRFQFERNYVAKDIYLINSSEYKIAKKSRYIHSSVRGGSLAFNKICDRIAAEDHDPIGYVIDEDD